MPISAESVLSFLRKEPSTACDEHGFLVNYNPNDFHWIIGGECQISKIHKNDSVYQLDVNKGQGDYFFPFVPPSKPAAEYCDDNQMALLWSR